MISSVYVALAPNDLAGYVTTFMEITGGMKCRLALDSIALRYPCPSMCLMSEEKVG